MRHLVEARIPAFSWLRRYDASALRPDLVAGVTTASVVIPKAMAFATIAGLAVQVGLYTALVPMVVYALLGSSLRLSVSTTTTIAILTAAEIAAVSTAASADAATITVTLAVMVGILMTIAAILRLGFVAQFISEPVLTGFKAGIGIVITIDQLPKLLGLHPHASGTFGKALATLGMLPELHTPTMALGLATIAVMVLLEIYVPKAPAPLLGVAFGIAASGLLGLSAYGVETIGAVVSGLPRLTLPDTWLAQWLWPGALGIALMSFTESIAAGRAFAPPGERRPDANQELLAIGAANIFGGLSGAMPAGGGTTQTAVNQRAGARTPIASLATVAVTAAVLLFLAPLLSLMPQATLAAIVIVTSVGLVDPAAFLAIRGVRTLEFRWALAAAVGVITLGTLRGIVVAIVLSMVTLLRQANDPQVHVLVRKRGTDVFRPQSAEHPTDDAIPGVLILRPEGRLYFANAQRVVDKILALVQANTAEVVLLDLSAVPDIEFTGLKALADMERSLRESSRALAMAALNPSALAVIQRSKLGAVLGRERLFFTVDTAVRSLAGGSTT